MATSPGNVTYDNYSNYTQLNQSAANSTMHIKPSINDDCKLSHGIPENGTVCSRGGLGISLSTPILMLSFGVLGNIIALIVLFTAKREMRKTVFYTFLFGLGWTDLIGQLMTGPIAIVVYANDLQWVGGEPVCKYHAFSMICFGLITPLFICSMSVERFLALRCPYFHTRVVNKKKAKLVILSCWIFVLVFCSLPLLGFGGYEHQFPGSWCFLNFHRESPSDIAYAYSYALTNISVIAIIIICNFVVMCTLIKMRKSRKINNSPSMERRHGVRQRSKLKVEEETQMMWFLCAITIVFTTCVLPLNVHIIINQLTGRVNYAADLIGVRLASINQILDPWLYILLRKRNIVKGFHFLKRFLTQRHKEQSQTCGARRFITHGTHSDGSSEKLKHAHELQQYNPDIKVSVNGNVSDDNGNELQQYNPDIKVSVNGNESDDNSNLENSDSSSCSTVHLIQNVQGRLRPGDRPVFGRSVSADAAVTASMRGRNECIAESCVGESNDISIPSQATSVSASLLRIIKWHPKHGQNRQKSNYVNGTSA